MICSDNEIQKSNINIHGNQSLCKIMQDEIRTDRNNIMEVE